MRARTLDAENLQPSKLRHILRLQNLCLLRCVSWLCANRLKVLFAKCLDKVKREKCVDISRLQVAISVCARTSSIASSQVLVNFVKNSDEIVDASDTLHRAAWIVKPKLTARWRDSLGLCIVNIRLEGLPVAWFFQWQRSVHWPYAHGCSLHPALRHGIPLGLGSHTSSRFDALSWRHITGTNTYRLRINCNIRRWLSSEPPVWHDGTAPR